MVLLSPQQLGAFLGAAVLITVAPGPDNLMVLGTGISRGRREGMAFGLGCALGCLSHTVLAALGVSALIAASPLAYGALKLCGGVYLAWLGIQALRSTGGAFRPGAAGRPAGSLRGLFTRGLIANAINPKVILFFLAFLPQFVDAGRGGVGLQTAQLGIVFTVVSVVLFGALGYFAGHVGAWLGRHARAPALLDRASGVIFVLVGLRLIVSR